MAQRWFLFSLSLFLVVSCASSKNASEKLKNFTREKNYTKAIELIQSDEFYPEERSKLLKLLELGSLHYLNGNFYQSLMAFDQAQDLSDKLFTISLSKKVTSTLFSDSLDNYYGEKYERSLIRFYQALLHYKLYQIGLYEAYEIKEKNKDGEESVKKILEKKLSQSEKRTHLMGARASIVEWDTLLSSYKEASLSQNVYKTDLMAKLFGAFIHEEIGTNAEKQIARQLYLDAKDVLFKYYNLYPSFNKKHEKFSKDYEKLSKLSRAKVEKDYIEPTDYAKNLLTFIDSRLSDLSRGNKDNVKLFVLKDFVAEKRAKKIEFPLPMSNLTVSTTANISSNRRGDYNQKNELMSITSFTFFVLSISSAATPLIDFELPSVEKKTSSSKLEAVVLDQAGKEILRKDIVLMDPVSDIAYDTMESKITSTYARIGARVALKHVAAILAAYTIYKNNPNLLGQGLGLASYIAASKGIAKSEEADLRYWSTLPSSTRMTSFKLPKGSYTLVIEESAGEKKTQYPQGTIIVTEQENVVLDIKI